MSGPEGPGEDQAACLSFPNMQRSPTEHPRDPRETSVRPQLQAGHGVLPQSPPLSPEAGRRGGCPRCPKASGALPLPHSPWEPPIPQP